MEVDDKELWERLTVVEQSTKSAHHRLDSLDRLTESVHILATETKAMREDVSDITSRAVSYTHLYNGISKCRSAC